ncbi:hypothetical protein [Rhizobium sp. BK176]|uniref:hypothetical protein n=1 Tax=Rhizobium sp. BK176 TaxID=2587071 RepID=UPI00216AA5DC|nr:hypothetical protein [Rhizobium sp. BK176]MCS4089715.1 hypothetical protein [Rhizobium sp. BK176]
MTAWHGLTDPAFGAEVTSEEFFVKGGCHQLALALVSTVEGSAVVAIYDSISQDGLELDEPWLVHAGAMVGDAIIDVEGIHDRDIWIEAWADQAREPSFVEWAPDEIPFEFTSPAHERFSTAVASRLVAALFSEPLPPRQAAIPSTAPLA